MPSSLFHACWASDSSDCHFDLTADTNPSMCPVTQPAVALHTFWMAPWMLFQMLFTSDRTVFHADRRNDVILLTMTEMPLYSVFHQDRSQPEISFHAALMPEKMVSHELEKNVVTLPMMFFMNANMAFHASVTALRICWWYLMIRPSSVQFRNTLT